MPYIATQGRFMRRRHSRPPTTMKRVRDEAEEVLAPIKRYRVEDSKQDRLSRLSHEVTLRILSNLTVGDIAVCHRVSRHFLSLCSDSQLWKAYYYNRFVRPRAARLPGVRDSTTDSAQHLHFSSKLSKWLDEDKLVRRGRETNWKRQYKLRHNWAQGTCSVSEVPVSEGPSVPPLLVAMHESTIFLADQESGLRAWSSASGEKMLAHMHWDSIPAHDRSSPPTALAVDASKPSESPSSITLALGFQDGSFALLSLDQHARVFRPLYRHAPSSNGMLTSLALSLPYLSTMTATQLLSVYTLPSPLAAPTLIHSLHSTSVLPPLTLSIRRTPTATVLATAYTLSTLTSPLLAIQELHLDPQTSQPLASRLTTSDPLPARPQALTYHHPYLLAANADNTLTLHRVTSNDTALDLGKPQLLWGHTSAVSGTSIGARGRAISVSRGGDDVRVWDLEARGGARGGGVRVTPSKEVAGRQTPGRAREWGRPGTWACEAEEMCLARGWVGFDEENVVLLKERAGRGQTLVVYDFA